MAVHLLRVPSSIGSAWAVRLNLKEMALRYFPIPQASAWSSWNFTPEALTDKVEAPALLVDPNPKTTQQALQSGLKGHIRQSLRSTLEVQCAPGEYLQSDITG
ncbi:MAG: hypothetical protein Q9159_000434 [Coniocarpon cinnabarinum]